MRPVPREAPPVLGRMRALVAVAMEEARVREAPGRRERAARIRKVALRELLKEAPRARAAKAAVPVGQLLCAATAW